MNEKEALRARWDAMVARGFRAQLRSGSILTGQMYVAIDFFPNAPKAEIDWTRNPPVLPTIPSTLEEVQQSVVNIVHKIDNMPLDEIGIDLGQSLGTLNRTLTSTDKLVKGFDSDITPAVRATLADARKTLQSANKTLSADSPLLYETQELMRELNKT